MAREGDYGTVCVEMETVFRSGFHKNICVSPVQKRESMVLHYKILVSCISCVCNILTKLIYLRISYFSYTKFNRVSVSPCPVIKLPKIVKICKELIPL